MKKEKSSISKNRTIIYLILGMIALTLVLFAVGVMINNARYAGTKVTYNNFDFVKDEKSGFWFVQFNIFVTGGKREVTLSTRYSPPELEYIPIDDAVSNFFQDEGGKQIDAIYLTLDPETNNNSAMAVAGYDLAANLARIYGISVHSACTANTSERCSTMPIITCDDAYPVIYLKESSAEKVTLQPHRCIVIEGNNLGLAKAVNRLLFQWYGIMN